jgi:glycosyltransferase involved in cell wall biosynthesis
MSVPDTPDGRPQRQWIISQIGSRELYACPLSFHQQGALRLFYTDAWCDRFRNLISRMPSPYWGLSRRYHPDLPREKVVAFTTGIVAHYAWHALRRRPPTTQEQYQDYIDVGKWFSTKVARHLSRQTFDSRRDTLFLFSTGALETLEFAHRKELFTVIDQLDPAKTDELMIRQESERWPGWEALPGAIPQFYYDRLAQEWALADMIVVNSEFSRRAMIEQGVAPEKLIVVPLAYEPETADVAPRKSSRDKPLQVLWLGQVVLRKGIPYLFEAARRLAGENVQFQVAGRIGINDAGLHSAPKNVNILGRVTRQRAIELYRSCDVFVLPTISDGFAITQLEAMSHGLPVITTPNCGDVVTPGTDGEIIPIRDPEALAASISRLANDRGLLEAMSSQALFKSQQFTLHRYQETITLAADRIAAGGPRHGRAGAPVAHQWIISQIGARQHYGVPRGFAAIGQFKLLYTDVWCPGLLRPFFLRGEKYMRAFATRWHPDISPRQVVHHNLQAIRDALHRERGTKWTVAEMHFEYLRVGRAFDAAVARDLRRVGRINPVTDAFFGFNTGCLETLHVLRDRGVPTVVDQIDPAKVEEDIVLAECVKWPGWQADTGRIPQEYWDRLAAEWAATDLVLVNSNWTREALLRQNVPAEKILVVDMAYEPEAGPVPLPWRRDRPLTILWMGSVILRKGIQYLVEAAKLLKDTDLKFIVAGPLGITPQAVASAPPNMTFLGRITRDQTNQIYQTSDVFVLPTLSDGFAVTQVEAMNRGLPVITTPNCGEVVTHGVDGLIVPAGDAKALADAIVQLDQNRELLAEMSQNAFIRSTQFLLPRQARQVEAAVRKYQAGLGASPTRTASQIASSGSPTAAR